MIRHLHLHLFALAVLLAACAAPPPPASTVAPAPISVKLIAFNDFHGNLRTPATRVPVPDATQPTGVRFEVAGGVEQFAAMVERLRAANPNSLVVTAGDLVGATPLLSALFRDEPTIEAMNLVGVDVHAVGNHEFDYGPQHLKRLQVGGCPVNNKTGATECGDRAPFTGARFPFLAANVRDVASGQTLFPAYVIKEVGGTRIAFIGMTLQDTPSIVRPGGTAGLTFQDEVLTANALVPEIRAKGVEAIVVLVHEGGEQSGGINDCKDVKGKIVGIAERLSPFIDVIVSAHTHRYYICEIGGKLVTSAGSYGTLLTEIDLSIDRATGDVISRRAQNVVVDPRGPRAPALTALVERYNKLAAPMENRVVAKVTGEINTVANTDGESALGNLIADAQLFATAAPDQGAAVIALNNPGSLRAPIIPDAEGGVTYGALFKVQPFQNDLIVMTLTGKQIRTLLEQQFGDKIAERPRIFGVSKGLTFKWNPNKPRGERIVTGSLKLHGQRIGDDLQYRVTANSFSAGGAEGFTTFLAGTDRQVSVLDVEALVQFLGAHSPYTPPPLGGRITRVAAE